MIDLNKKYRLADGGEVVLCEVVGNQVFGRFRNRPDAWWLPASWCVCTGDYVVTRICTSEQKALVRKRRALVEVKPFKIDEPGLYEDEEGRFVTITNVGFSVSAGVITPAAIADHVMCWNNDGSMHRVRELDGCSPPAPLVKKIASFEAPELS